jgi:hypothetical protein
MSLLRKMGNSFGAKGLSIGSRIGSVWPFSSSHVTAVGCRSCHRALTFAAFFAVCQAVFNVLTALDGSVKNDRAFGRAQNLER